MNTSKVVMPGRLLRLGAVAQLVGLARSTIYADRTFPRPIKIGPRASAWLECEVLEWIDQRIRASREQP